MNDEPGADLEPLVPLDPDAPEEASRPLASGEERAPGRGPLDRRWLWAGGIVAIALWIGLWVAFATVPDRGARGHEPPAAVTTAAPVPSFGPDPFGEALGRFAAVVDGRLWIVDAGSREVRGAHGVGRAEILAVSGSSVLVRSRDANQRGRRFLVDTRTGAAVRAATGAWFPRLGGGWWIANDPELSSASAHYRLPAGFVALAEVVGGFAVAPANGDPLRLWSPQWGFVRPLGNLPHTRFLAAEATRLALGDAHCPAASMPRCSIEIVDVGTGRVTSVPVPFADQFVRDAVFSSDGSRLAIWGPSGVALVDTADGSIVVTLKAARLTTVPLAFTPDGAALLVLEDPRPYRQVVVLAAGDGRFVRTWVSEQQLEQIVALSS